MIYSEILIKRIRDILLMPTPFVETEVPKGTVEESVFKHFILPVLIIERRFPQSVFRKVRGFQVQKIVFYA